MTDREIITEIDIQDHEAGPDEMVSVDPLEEGLSDPVHDLEELVESGDLEALDRFISVLHPADLAALFGFLSKAHWPPVVSRLSIARVSDLMEELSDHLRDDLAEHLKPDQLTEAIEEMASDDAADVLADLPAPLARDLIEALPDEDRQEVETLLKYPEDSAGGLMQVELVSVPETSTVEKTIEAVRANELVAVPEDMIGHRDVYVLKVKGESMVDEQVREGDYVVVESRAEARNGEMVVALLDGENATLKKYYREKEEIRLQPAHPTMKPIYVKENDLKIQGVVIGLLRKY